MTWKLGQPYKYNLAEWLGVFFALIGTPTLVYTALGVLGMLPKSTALVFNLVFGGFAVAGWTLLVLGTRAHRRAIGPSSA
ncbi:MAG: hypothetical protein WB947_00590 [Thermoplasmata archaeon]